MTNKKGYKEWDIYPEWESLTPLPEDKNAQELWFKEWDLFVNVLSDTLTKWKIVRLIEDDWSCIPLFNTLGYELLDNLAPLPKDTPPQTPEKKKPTYEVPIMSKQYTVFVEGKQAPTVVHDTVEEAQKEAQRLCKKTNCKTCVCQILESYDLQVVKV